MKILQTERAEIIENLNAGLTCYLQICYFRKLKSQRDRFFPLRELLIMDEEHVKKLNEDLYLAAENGNYDDAKRLIENGADVNHRGIENRTLLHVCADVNIIRLLLENNAEVNAKDDALKTALHWTVLRDGDRDIYKVLVDHGADLGAKDSYGSTALHFAAWLGKAEAAEKLIELGANLQIKNNLKRTPLIDAYLRDHDELMDILQRAELRRN